MTFLILPLIGIEIYIHILYMYVYVQKVYTIVLHFNLSSGLSYKPLAYAIIHISNITDFCNYAIWEVTTSRSIGYFIAKGSNALLLIKNCA